MVAEAALRTLASPPMKRQVKRLLKFSGVAGTVKSLSQSFQGRALLKENGLRTWRDKCLKELEPTNSSNEWREIIFRHMMSTNS